MTVRYPQLPQLFDHEAVAKKGLGQRVAAKAEGHSIEKLHVQRGGE
jgi:hypothetical protein